MQELIRGRLVVPSAVETLLGKQPVESDSTAGGGFDPCPKQMQLK